jgi:probable phosphoglycerate mutase
MLYLVRHAAHGRVGTTLCGRMPGVTLDKAGRRQAERMAEHLAGESISAVFSSPLERALATAEPIAARHALGVRVSDKLNEIDFGDWTGRTFEELSSDLLWRRWNQARTAVRPPNGEPISAAHGRMRAFLEEVRATYPEAGAVVVTHGDLIRSVLCEFLNCRSLSDYALFEISPGSITRIAFWPGGWRVVNLNEAVAA